jgi:hypothetical protein
MSSEEQAMSVEEVRENLDIRQGAPDERCPACGRQYGHESIDVHVPGQPDKKLGVLRCGYCETLFDLSGEGEAPHFGAELGTLRRWAKQMREENNEADSHLNGVSVASDLASVLVSLRNRDGFPFSPAVINLMLRFSGVGDVLNMCKCGTD